MPLSTATPKSAMNPIPADMLNGIPLIRRRKTPPTMESGTAVNIKAASLKELKAKCRKIKINKSAMGTASLSLLDAFLRFSNCPP